MSVHISVCECKEQREREEKESKKGGDRRGMVSRGPGMVLSLWGHCLGLNHQPLSERAQDLDPLGTKENVREEATVVHSGLCTHSGLAVQRAGMGQWAYPSL